MECIPNKQVFLLWDSRCLGRASGLLLSPKKRLSAKSFNFIVTKASTFIPHHHLLEDTVPGKKNAYPSFCLALDLMQKRNWAVGMNGNLALKKKQPPIPLSHPISYLTGDRGYFQSY